MDIHINASGHPNHTSVIKFYTQKIHRKYAKYPFVKTAEVMINQSKRGLYKVSICMDIEKSPKLYSVHSDESENRALQGAIKKMNIQIEKYKQKHYHNHHAVSKESRFSSN